MRVEARELRKRYGAVEALRGVSFVIPAGGRVALIGPNGSGKSTLIRALLGLVECDGEITIDGKPPFWNRATLAHRIAYVPQTPPRLSATVAELADITAAVRGLDRARIAAVAGRLALDFDAIARRPFKNLSGGMKQKLLNALAFAAGAECLLFDEPTASLDVDARERFCATLRDVPPETTVILCTHRAEDVAGLTTHAIALGEGRVVYDGDVAGLDAALRAGTRELFAGAPRLLRSAAAAGDHG